MLPCGDARTIRRLMERLVVLPSWPGPWKGMLINSGAEAVENAIKLARSSRAARQSSPSRLVSRPHADDFGPDKQDAHLQERFGPFLGGYRLPYAYCYRCPIHLHYPECGGLGAGSAGCFRKPGGAGDVAGLIVEPVQGEGGFVVPPREYLARLQETCRRYGILFIVHEVQTGVARTGTRSPFSTSASNRTGCPFEIDRGRLPLSAVLGRAAILDSRRSAALGDFRRNPVSCAAA